MTRQNFPTHEKAARGPEPAAPRLFSVPDHPRAANSVYHFGIVGRGPGARAIGDADRLAGVAEIAFDGHAATADLFIACLLFRPQFEPQRFDDLRRAGQTPRETLDLASQTRHFGQRGFADTALRSTRLHTSDTAEDRKPA